MKTKHRFKSIEGAVRRIRQLEKIIEQYRDISGDLSADNQIFDQDRKLMARLAADGPCFDNPLIIYEAKCLRDRLLAMQRLTPDGKYMEARP
jgi:hypothetical protein